MSFVEYATYINSGQIIVVINDLVRITHSLSTYLNTWLHIALINNSGDLNLYINGNLVESIIVNENIITTNDLLIGSDNTSYINGKLTNFRWTNDVVYSSNFNVSTMPLSTLSKTILLFKASSVDKVIFNSANNLFTIDNIDLTWSQSSPFSPWETEDGSIQFNGLSSYLRINNLNNFNIFI